MKELVRAYVFTYKRPRMVESVVNRLKGFGISPIVICDEIGSGLNIDGLREHEHRGKEGFHITWREVLSDCKKNKAEIYLFMPDDFQDIEMWNVLKYHQRLKDSPYAYNIINDGRGKSWNNIEPKVLENNMDVSCGFVDCGFFCNRSALSKIRYTIKAPIINKRMTSSGVGKELTNSFNKCGVKMYFPLKSLAYHGDHESVMNPKERLNNPLNSIH